MNKSRFPIRFFNHLRSFYIDFAFNKNGVVAVIVALTMVPLILAIGASLDIGKAYIVKQRLLQATDSAGLAIAAAIDEDSTNAELQEILDDFIAANFTTDARTTIDSTSFTYIGSDVTVTAQVSVDTAFMRIANINDLTVNAESTVTRQEDNLEVVLVLDNSGSMSGSKLTALKEASNSLVDILIGTSATSSQVKIGLVPFSNNVNIGTSNTAYMTDTTADDWGTTSWGGCVMAQTTSDNDTKDDVTGSWDPMYWADDSNNNWYYSGGYHISSSKGPNKYCIENALTPLTNVKATLTTAIDDMVAYGGTHINLGAIWGWRVISPSEPFSEGVAYGTADSSKAVIILTDGANTAYSYIYDAFGYPSDELLGSGINTASEVADEIDNRLATICTNIKATGVTVYTITFSLSDATTEALFEACATDTDKYYDSPTTAELTRTFRSIAAELKQLHVIN